jgi:lipopolysaccharide/colanic/teichoic acid biosynthesis glycosyltransferase
MDLSGALAGLALAGIPLGIVAALVRLDLGAPVLFRQTRPGFRGRPFDMLKLRTMRDAVDSSGNPLPDSERLTRFGRFLRAASLDELPELLNVLKGDMSLVGPRPLLMEYMPLYSPAQARRHDVKPGITGWAQINGRNALTWEEKFRLDCWYVDNWSNQLDLWILVRTVWSVVRREGISHGADATMPRFTGPPPERRNGTARPNGSGKAALPA